MSVFPFLKKSERAYTAVAYLLGLGLTFFLSVRYLLAHFYKGGYILDSGLLAQLVWRNPTATSEHTVTGTTYYATHVCPLFTVLSLISYLTPLNHAEFFLQIVKN